MSMPVPVMGASLPAKDVGLFRDWILEGQRDLEIDDPFYSDRLDGDWQPLVAQVRHTLAGYTGRIGIHGPTESLPIWCDDRRVSEIVQLRLRQGLAFAKALDATHMVLHSPFTFFGNLHVVHTYGTDLTKEIQIIHQTLGEIVADAEAQECMIVIEVCSDLHTRPLIELVRSFQSKYVQLSLDVGHARIMQEYGGPTPDQWVRDAADLLAHVHIQDTDGLYDHHWAPGDGSINWYAFFDAVKHLNHMPRMIMEVAQPSLIMRGFDYLRTRGYVV